MFKVGSQFSVLSYQRSAISKKSSYQRSAISKKSSYQRSAISFQERKVSVIAYNCSVLASLPFTAFLALDCRLAFQLNELYEPNKPLPREVILVVILLRGNELSPIRGPSVLSLCPESEEA